MKIKSIITFLILLNIGCSSSKKFYNSGNVIIENDVEIIEIKFINNLPLCKVNINNNEYYFLLDTGAPTVISEEIFKKFNLNESHSASISDSQNRKQTEIFTVLPEIKIGNIVFENIGSAVVKFENQELKCYGFDGIIGANILSKLYWKFDYKNNKIMASKSLSFFEIDTYDFLLNFKPKHQKTPIINGRIKDKTINFTFDTGYSGNIKIPNEYEFYKNMTPADKFISKMGINSIGIYGNSDNEKTFEIKNDLFLNNILFENELIDSGQSTLIGNDFLKDYTFVIDWMKNKIYFKRNLNLEIKKLKGFGFFYLFIEGKPKVVAKIENKNVLINIGDEVLSINETDFTQLKDSDVCNFFLNKVEKNENEINIKVKRANDTLNLNLKKQVFLE